MTTNTKRKARGKAKSTIFLEAEILEIVEARNPITVRGVAYALFTRGLIGDMNTNNTAKVSRVMTEMRECGSLDWTRRMMRDEPRVLHSLLEKLTDMTAGYLNYQIAQGVHAVQMFESVSDLLSAKEYREFAHPYHERVISRVNRESAPIILFAKEQANVELMVETVANAISVGRNVDLREVCGRFGDRVAVQGNVDNEVLRSGTAEDIRNAVETCIREGGCKGHILNLNHGVFRDTPIENVRLLIETCRAWDSGNDELERAPE